MRRPRSVVCGGLQLEVVWAAVCRGHCEEATVSCVGLMCGIVCYDIHVALAPSLSTISLLSWTLSPT